MKAIYQDKPIPLYHQARESIQHFIVARHLKAGDRLPTETELVKMLGVSLITVRRALAELEINGVVSRLQGRGTFVRAAPMEHKLEHLSGFAEEMRELNHNSSAKVLAIEHTAATEEVAAHLNLRSGEDVVRVDRVRFADDVPVMFNVVYLPREVGEKVEREDLTQTPIFSLLEEKYGIPLIEADYQMEAVIAPRVVQKALQLASREAAFFVRRTTYTSGRRPIDYTLLWYKGDQFRYAVHVQRARTGGMAMRVRGQLRSVS